MSTVDREGTFRASIVGYGLKSMDSGAVAVAIRAKLIEIFDGAAFQQWEQYEQEADGDIWIVKTDGSVNSGGAESLIRHAGWDGNLESIAGETWQPTLCQVTVKREEYKGNVRFKIAFVNDYERIPGSLSNCSPDKARELNMKYGSQFRAIAGNVKRNGPAAPAGRPPAPSARSAPVPPPAPVAAIPDGDPIPF